MSSVLIEEQLEVPGDIRSLADFRGWALSDSFPEQGRIDYISGRIEIAISPPGLFTHSAPKTELIGRLGQVVKEDDLGLLVCEPARFSSVPADLSATPDLMLLSDDAIDSGRIRFIYPPGGTHDPIEAEGGPDLVVEVVADNTAGKDTERLPAAYFAARVTEFWLIDARGEQLAFQIHRRGEAEFKPVMADKCGFQRSHVFSRLFKFDRERDRRGHWDYDLHVAKAKM